MLNIGRQDYRVNFNFEHLDIALASIALYALVVLVFLILIFIKKKFRTYKVFTYFIRVTTILLLLLTVSGPFLESEKLSSKSYVLIDVSDSNHEPLMQEMLSKLESIRQEGVERHYIPFAGNVYSNTLDSLGSGYRDLKLSWSKLDIGKTNLEKALSSLENKEPGSIILVSDGYETEGNVIGITPGLKQSGFKIYPLLPENVSPQQEVLAISNLYAPLVSRAGSAVNIKTSIRNDTKEAQNGLLEIKHGDKTIFSRNVEISPAKEEIFSAESDPSQEGIKEINAVFTPSKKTYASSSRTIFLSGEKGEKILLISGAQEDQRFLVPVMQSQSYQLKSLLPDDLKNGFPEIKDYKAVIFNNIALNQIPKGSASTLEDYVEQGGSFIMIGGNRSFGLGGYINSPIEEVLPVELLPPQKEEKRLNVAVQLLLDKSRSMADGNRIDFAKEAAIEVVDNLKDEDYLGVMGFDVNPFVVIRLARLSEIRSEATRRIGLLYPNKGTSVVAAIDEGRRDLVRVNAGRKHMLILTDGEITDAPKHYYYEMIKQVRLLGITVSTVMLGSEGDQSMLQQMADLGGGAFYRTTDARALPKIFISDLKVASGERTMKEQSEYAVRVGPSGTISTIIESYPDLKGYVQTKIKNKANLELVALAQNKAEPLLASWSYGKGKSIAFTSDANGRWSQSWIGWARFQIFWQNLIDSLRTESESPSEQVKFDLRTYYENAKLNIDLSVYSEAERSSIDAEIILPDKSSKSINLRAVAPGRYFAEIENPKAGKYEFHAKFAAKSLTPVAFYLSGDLLGEIKGQGFNMPLLRNLADTSGGKINPTIEDLKGEEYTSLIKDDISIYLILAALALLLLEILLREGAISLRSKYFPLRST